MSEELQGRFIAVVVDYPHRLVGQGSNFSSSSWANTTHVGCVAGAILAMPQRTSLKSHYRLGSFPGTGKVDQMHMEPICSTDALVRPMGSRKIDPDRRDLRGHFTRLTALGRRVELSDRQKINQQEIDCRSCEVVSKNLPTVGIFLHYAQ
jgi:hypothetical protein